MTYASSLVFILYTVRCLAGVLKRDPSEQIRFAHCEKDLWNVVTYNARAPQGKQEPDDFLVRTPWAGGWNTTSTSSRYTGSSARSINFSYGLPGFSYSNDAFGQYIGSLTYGSAEFGCFQDDRHAVWTYANTGVCYVDAYCIH